MANMHETTMKLVILMLFRSFKRKKGYIVSTGTITRRS